MSFALVAGVSLGALAQATNPVVLYHGYITNTRNEPVSGSYALKFSLFDAATAGTEVWTETQNATVDNGNLAVALGKTTALTPALFADKLEGASASP
jgi:hypothetical protein